MFWGVVGVLGLVVVVVGGIGLAVYEVVVVDPKRKARLAEIRRLIARGKVVLLAAVAGGGMYLVPVTLDLSTDAQQRSTNAQQRLNVISTDVGIAGLTVDPSRPTLDNVFNGSSTAPSNTPEVNAFKDRLEDAGYTVIAIPGGVSSDEIAETWHDEVDELFEGRPWIYGVDRGGPPRIDHTTGLIGVFAR